MAEFAPQSEARERPSASKASDGPTPLPVPAEAAPRRRAWWPWVGLAGLAVVAGLAVATRPAGDEGGGSPKADSATAVELGTVERRDMVVRSRYPGEVFADAAEVSSRLAGQVREIKVRIGDEVTADQVLARLDDDVLRRRIQETQAQLAASRAAVDGAVVAHEASDRNHARAETLLKSGAGSEQELDDAQTLLRTRAVELATAKAQRDAAAAQLAVLRQDLADTTVRAPFAGIVARRDVDPGTFVSVGQPLLRLVANEPKRVRFRIPEYDVADFRPGLLFRLVGPALGGKEVTGEVTRLAGEVSASDRTLLVEGIIRDATELRPGTYVDVVVQRGSLEGALVVQASAVLERVDAGGMASTGLFVAEGDRTRWVPVRVRSREGDVMAVESTGGELHDGDAVLIAGHRDLADGAPIRAVTLDSESTP